MATFKGVVKQCEVCGGEFRAPQSQKHVRTCSPKCGYQIRKVANKAEWVGTKCKLCGKEFKERPCHVERRVYCSKECHSACPEARAAIGARFSGSNSPNWKGGVMRHVVSSAGKAYTRTAPEVEQAKYAKRRAAKLRATPMWASGEKVSRFYAEAQRVSTMLGVTYHVDHIVPLVSGVVCGLHCEFNLQLLPGIENLRKHNRHWPNMP